MKKLSVPFTAAVLVFAGACSNGGEGTVEVALTEFDVRPNPASADAGEITFDVNNAGEETHEIVIVSTDLTSGDLPTADDGSFDEERVEVVDEIEDMEAGSSEELTVDLEPGSYVLACNVVEEEDGETEAHYAEGMHTAFEVS